MDRQALYRGPISWMARNPVAANLLMVVLLVGGAIATLQIRKEVFPRIEPDRVEISMVYPGASPEEVEQGILLAIEEAVRPLDGVKEVVATAAESMGRVTVELHRGANKEKALSDVKNAIDRITSFPEEAERPIVNLPAWRAEAIWLVLYGDQPDQVLHALAERVRDEMLAEDDITYVETFGLPPLEMEIEVAQETLRRYGLTLPQIAQTVRRTALELPAGGVKTKGGEWLLRTAERRDLAQEFATVPVVAGAGGQPIELGDIARINDTFAETDMWAAFEGKPAVVVEAYSVGDESPTDVARAVKRYAAELESSLPPGVQVATFMDRSKMYEERLDLLLRNAAIGLALVLVILGIFLEPRLAFWVTMGIPISFLGSMVLLPWLDVSINMISLFGFIVTLGMVVDDAIVVGENAFRFRRQGHGPLKAAVMGARQVATPVFFSIATSIAAFSPLLFVPGIRGKFMLAIPVVVILVLAMSLVESFFILPAHLAHVRAKGEGQRGLLGRLQARVSRGVERFIEKIYLPLVGAAVRQWWATLAVAVALLVASWGLIAGGVVKTVDFPKEESDWVVAEARFPYGTAVQETEAAMDRIIRAARRVIEANGGERISQGIFSMIGVSFMGHGGRQAGGHVTSLIVMLVPSDERDISSWDFVSEWREAIGDIPGLEAMSFDSSTGRSSKPIDMRITHRQIPVLEEAARDLAERLASFEGLEDIDNGIELGKPQLDFTMTAAGTKAGLTPADLAAQVRAAFYGAEALRQQRGRHEIRVMVRLPEPERVTLASVENMIVRTPAGGEMPLREAAHVDYGRAYTSIRRVDGKRVIRVQADVDDEVANAQEVMRAVYGGIMPELQQKYPGLSFGSAGRQRDWQDFQSFLITALGVALLVMFALVAVPLNSFLQPLFVVMIPAILFGMVGAILGHLLMDMPLSMISWMGMLALAGVVVNDSLVLVAAANRIRKEEGLGPRAAARAAAGQRFRPVVLTSLTTFGGLAPMIFETSVQARVLIPMAVSLGFGVLFATLIILLLVPSAFVMIERVRGGFKRFWLWLFPIDESAAEPEATGRDSEKSSQEAS
jgi:multidrug efflux pump subunit AcrB